MSRWHGESLLVSEGYPPEAVLLELYLSGELGYALSKAARAGFIEQSRFHSPTSQYGTLTRGPRFVDPELRERMRQGLAEIRSGQFAREWAEERARGYPMLAALRQAARSLPLHELEQRTIRAFWGEGP